MARRRVNKRLLLILVCGFIVLLGPSWAHWQTKIRQRDPSPYMLEANQLIDQKQYRRAIGYYNQARKWAGRRGDTDMEIEALVQMSKALPHLDVEGAVLIAIKRLDQAVIKDPNSIKANKARLEMQFEIYQENLYSLRDWEELRQSADNVIKAIKSHPDEKFEEDNARAHYLRGLAMLRVIGIQAGMTDQEQLTDIEGALDFFVKAWQYQPSSADRKSVV